MRLPMPRPGRLDGLLALAAALVGLGALALVTPDPGERGADALAVALVLIGAAGLLPRRAPLAALAVTASVAVAAAAIGYPPWGFLPAPLAALFLVALEGGRTRLVAVATGAAGAAVLATALFGHEATLAAPETAAHVALVLLPLAAGEALRQRRAHVAELVRRAEEQERLRIARDLHDVAAHTITAISVQAGVAAHLVARDPARAEGALTAIAQASREALDELRAVVGVLRDRGDDAAPLRPAPTIAGIDELVREARRGGLDVELETTGRRPERLPESLEVAAYRIVQEALTNARRHAGPVKAGVLLTFAPDGLLVAVRNARGATAAGDVGRPGVGLVGMRERAAAAGGDLTARATPDGFEVRAELPLRAGG
jgi:signal transduction histidine kinase